jgi:hypothetical protein
MHEGTGRNYLLRDISVDGTLIEMVAGFALEVFVAGDQREWFILGVPTGAVQVDTNDAVEVVVRTYEGFDLHGPAIVTTSHAAPGLTSLEVRFASEPSQGFEPEDDG